MEGRSGRDLEEMLDTAVSRAKAIWPQAAELSLQGLAWVSAVCGRADHPILDFNRSGAGARGQRDLLLPLFDPVFRFCTAGRAGSTSTGICRRGPRTPGLVGDHVSGLQRRTAMTTEQRGQEAARIADFRYGIIAELANPYLNREQRRRLLREKSPVCSTRSTGRGRKTLDRQLPEEMAAVVLEVRQRRVTASPSP